MISFELGLATQQGELGKRGRRGELPKPQRTSSRTRLKEEHARVNSLNFRSFSFCSPFMCVNLIVCQQATNSNYVSCIFLLLFSRLATGGIIWRFRVVSKQLTTFSTHLVFLFLSPSHVVLATHCTRRDLIVEEIHMAWMLSVEWRKTDLFLLLLLQPRRLVWNRNSVSVFDSSFLCFTMEEQLSPFAVKEVQNCLRWSFVVPKNPKRYKLSTDCRDQVKKHK